MAPMFSGAWLLAQVPQSAIFISPWKPVVMVVLFFLWALFAQWADKDAVRVNTFRMLWNNALLAVGAGALACLLLIPNFWGALGAYVGAVGTYMIVYVIHRNGLVRDEDKVLTAEHLKRLMTEGFSGKSKQPKEVKVRVALRDSQGQRVSVPEEEEPREQFRLTQDLLWDVIFSRAAKAVLSPGKDATRVAYAIDGIPSERDALPREEADAILVYLKQLAGLDLEERRKPQTGKIQATLGDHRVEIEVRTDGSTAGENLALRVIGEETSYKLDNLGLTDAQLEQMRGVMHEDHGLVLLSAPKGHGLTTTVYSITRTHDAFLQNIQTLEYTIELVIDNVTQVHFKPKPDATFAGDLQKLFRADPDIVVLPEVREQAACVLATEAAVKKQLVYGALQASDVLSALKKWLELVNDNGKVAAALAAVTNQRLVRRLCETCKQAYKPDPTTLKKLNLPEKTVLYRQPEPEYDKRGEPIVCPACQGSGYVGRVAVFETLFVDEALRDVLRKAQSFADVQAHAAKQGGMSLQKQAIAKVLDGTTSIQEIMRVLRPKAASGSKSKARQAAG